MWAAARALRQARGTRAGRPSERRRCGRRRRRTTQQRERGPPQGQMASAEGKTAGGPRALAPGRLAFWVGERRSAQLRRKHCMVFTRGPRAARSWPQVAPQAELSPRHLRGIVRAQARWRGRLARRRYKSMRTAFDTCCRRRRRGRHAADWRPGPTAGQGGRNVARPLVKRAYIAREIWQTERAYVESLRFMHEVRARVGGARGARSLTRPRAVLAR